MLTEHGHGLHIEGTHSSHEGFLHVLFVEFFLRFEPGNLLVGPVHGIVDLGGREGGREGGRGNRNERRERKRNLLDSA